MKRYLLITFSVLFITALCFSGCARQRPYNRPHHEYDMPSPKLERETGMRALRTGQSPEAQKISDNVDSYFPK